MSDAGLSALSRILARASGSTSAGDVRARRDFDAGFSAEPLGHVADADSGRAVTVDHRSGVEAAPPTREVVIEHAAASGAAEQLGAAASFTRSTVEGPDALHAALPTRRDETQPPILRSGSPIARDSPRTLAPRAQQQNERDTRRAANVGSSPVEQSPLAAPRMAASPPLAPIPRRASPQAPRNIHVSIGRVEIRAQPGADKPASAPVTPKYRPTPLQVHLERRNTGGRS